MVAFDNNQVVGKSWHVSIDNKEKSSCLTSICAVVIDTGSFNFSNEKFIDKRLTADKCARKHICGHFCGMEGNNA